MLRYWWVILVVLGFLPALLFSSSLFIQISEADWSCSSVTFGDSAESYGYAKDSGDGVAAESVTCSEIPGQLIVASAILWAAPLSLMAALLYLLRRRYRGEGDWAVRSETTERDDTAVDWTGIFVRTVAVLVGLANALVIRDPLDILGSAHSRPLVALLGTSLLAAVAGLLASEIVLRIGRSALSGGFFARYGVTVLGLCFGGAILGGTSIALGILTGQPGAQSSRGFDPILLWAVLAYGSIAAVVGGVMGALEGLILAFPLAAILEWFRQPRGQARGASLPGLVMLCLLSVAAILSSVIATPPATPEAERAALRDEPQISCQGGKEEIASFGGPGDQTTPVFETTGDDWGYEFTWAGPGSPKIRVLDEEGNEVESPDENLPEDELLPGNGAGGTEFAFSGTFSLQIDTDDDVEYRVLVCD